MSVFAKRAGIGASVVGTRRAPLHSLAVAAAVAVAFADSSIVVLALPELYGDLDTSIVRVSWVITAFNLAAAMAFFALLPLLRRARLHALGFAGLGVFLGASLACGFSTGLAALVTARAVQGVGAALFLAASLPLLVGLAPRPERALALWTAAGTIGIAVGPALGGVLTELAGWRAIFIAQAPVAALALVAARRPGALTAPRERAAPAGRTAVGANLGLLLLFGALVGALFLAVLLVVTVWDLGPLAGAGVVSALPFGAVLARPLSRGLSPRLDTISGSLLLAAGLLALALLPASSVLYAVPALGLCGAGLGLAVPALTRAAVAPDLERGGIVSLGTRHAGLVLGLVLIAPLLAHDLDRGGDRATLNATAVILDAPLPLTTKIPIALDLRGEFEQTRSGALPDLATPFDKQGSADDPQVREARDSLLETIKAALTRSFRNSFGLAAILAALAVLSALALRRRPA